MAKADIGLIGLAVMGENLVLNMEAKGYTVAVYNRTLSKVNDFLKNRGAGKNIIGTYSLKELAESVKSPRKIMLMIKAGSSVDDMIEKLLPLLDPGDIIIDGGNSNYRDTMRRTAYVEGKGLLYVGTGVSGGEVGALNGPSMMPGGSQKAWPYVKPVFQAICAKTEDNFPCCDWVGENGAGHFVKMVHNGIEYGDMELICESYHIMKELLGIRAEEMGEIFASWNRTELNSYLIEITADILAVKDEDGESLVEHILDTAGQKGTGMWTAISSLEEGVPVTLITEAVFQRYLSSQKAEREAASRLYQKEKERYKGESGEVISALRKALLAAKIISYTQGYLLMKSAAGRYGWDLDYGKIALLWRGGCIIRSTFLGKIKEAFDRDPTLSNLLLDSYFQEIMKDCVPALRKITVLAAEQGIPIPAMASALTYFDGYTCRVLPANLLQAQRDYFGAHTYERTDRERGNFYHTDWLQA